LKKQAASGGAVQTTIITNGSKGEVISSPQPLAAARPQYPIETATGPHHTVRGVLRDVQCSYPSVIAMSLETSGKKIALYSNDMYKVDYSATNFEPGSNFNPCKALEGMKAVVEYADVSDKSVSGQVISVQLTK